MLLIFALVVSFISMFNSSAELKFMVFGLFIFYIITLFFNSKKLRLFAFVFLILGLGFLAYVSFNSQGVEISAVEFNSTSSEQGLKQGQVILAIDGTEIKTLEDYSNIIAGKFSSNESVKTIIQTNEGEVILFSNSPPQITVSEVSRTNINLGLDLAGGSRALIKAQDLELSSSEINDLSAVLENRLNVYGISDVNIRPVSDLSGNNFVLIEIAGATPDDIENLISQQGKFEAKIGNKPVFVGGEKDIASVSRNAQDSRIHNCQQLENTDYICEFVFSVVLSADAAERQAAITAELSVNQSQPEYLNESLDLYLDDKFVDSLRISKGLQGRVETQIAISGSETGADLDTARENAETEMKKLQTILITGSLPYKLEIVKLDTISPTLGKEFITSIFLAAFAALFVVALVVLIRYRKIKSSLAVVLTSFSEIIIILGVASLISWNIDLPGIAGILATLGTGIDQQIIVLDEARSKINLSLKQKLKRAFTIILGAYFTAFVAMLPLLWAGAGLLKGFAITTLIGISVGVFITRPAFTDIIKNIEG